MKRILFFICFLFTFYSSFACHNCTINNLSSVNNGNNTTTFTIDFTIDVGSLDGYSYGFALIFENSTATPPVVLNSPAYTPFLTKPSYNNLTAYTGAAIGTGMGAYARNYFDDRYGNRTDVLTYETDDNGYGFGSVDYTRQVVVTLSGCVETITIDGDFRSSFSATAAGNVGCTVSSSTGITCQTSCGTCPSPTCLIAGPYPSYNDAALFSNHCSQMNDLSANPITSSNYTSYHSLTSSANGTVGMVISVQEAGPTNPCGVTKVAKLYPIGTNCSIASAINPSTTTANGSTFYNPEWTGLTPNTNYIVEIEFSIPLGCSLVDHCESYYHPSSACSSDVGNISINGGNLVGTNHYELSNCQTITFNASGEDLNGGTLTYGWAVFNCQPTLPFTSAQISSFNNQSCYLGTDYGLSTNDQDAGGVSSSLPAYSSLWFLPYTSDAAGSLDSDGDGCYDYGDIIQVDYILESCGECSNPTCNVGSVPEFSDRTYLSCNNPCADLNDVTYLTYHTVTTDTYGNVGAVQTINFNISCSLNRSAVLRESSNSCSGPDISPSVLNANGVGSGFNPEWYSLSPNTNYTLIVTTIIGSNCNYDYGCLDYYGIPICNTINVTLDSTICNGGSFIFNGTTYDATNSSGVETITTSAGCDSVVTVTVTELAAITNTINPTICASGNYIYDGTTYDTSNLTGIHVFSSVTNCDSTVTITLNIQNSINTNLDTTLCNGESISVNGNIYNGANPTGQEVFSLLSGCDSIVDITITELLPITNSINPTICSNSTYDYAGTTYDSSNTNGVHVFTSSLGCDSTVTITLTLQSIINTTIDTLICSGESVEFNGNIYNAANPTGQEIFTLPAGCDSIVSINVTEQIPDTSFIDTTLYFGQFLEIPGEALIESDFSGLITTQAANGCDSIISVKVIMLYESAYFVPSGFSPNSDGNNDNIGVMGGGISSVNFYIYNRWGEKVFSYEGAYDGICPQDPLCKWDGTHNNTPVNVATYVYFLKGTYTNGLEFTEKGTISLIK